MKKFTLPLKKCLFFSAGILVCVFSGFDHPEEQTVLIQNILTKYYDIEAQGKEIKRYELNVTNTGFCRYRKIFNNGKEEYFAFNLSRFKSMDFYGTTTNGELYLRTKGEDVIVQTRNDRKGDIDSMGTYLIIPLKNLDVEQLNILSANLKQANESLLASLKK